MNEVYRAIPGHRNYEVSDHGNVRRIGRDRPLRPARHTNGYQQVNLPPVGSQLVHKLVMLAFVGPPPEGQPWINHKDGNKQNNHISNLEYGTAKWNREHAVHTGLHDGPPGSGKLEADDVLEINSLLKQGHLSQQAIGDLFGVNQRMVSSIKQGRSWQWLTGNGA
jgi:hypothetical protein